MKKIFFLFAALISAMTMSAVTYNVTVPAGTNACYIAGEMTGWSHTEMTKVDDTHYTLELADATEAMKYKYCSGPGWAYVEKTANGEEVADRTYFVEDVVEAWAAVYEPSATPEEPGETKDITVKAKVPAEWTDQITAWVWPTGGEGSEVVPTQEGEWYVYTHNCTELNIIFKNGAGWNGDANQTVDMTFSADACIVITAGSGKATYTAVDCPESGDTPVDPTPDPETGVTYNVTVPAGTNACYIAGEMTGWTQQEMTKVDETHYTITIAEATTAMKYKYCSGPAWEYVECGAEGEELGDREYSENDVVVAWRAVYTPEGGDTPVDPTPDPEEPKDITVKAKVPAEWTNTITAWVWAAGMDGQEVVPTQDGEWYVYAANVAELNIIFKNGAGWTGDQNQTVDITVTESTCIEITYNEGAKATYTAVDCPESGDTPVDPTPDPETGVTYNVTVPAGTNACYIAGEMTGWTQQEMTKVDETHYTITIAEATTAMKYKYCSGPAWEYVECGAEGEELGDREYSENDVVVAWRAVYTPEGGDTPVDPTPDPEDPKDITVKAKVPAEWTDPITVWVWATGMEGQEAEPTQEGEWYVYTHTGSELNIIFKNGAGWTGDQNQTVDITVTESTCIEITYNEGAKATYTVVDCEGGDTPVDPTPDPETGLTYNVTVPAGTNACYIAGEMTGWTQQEMTKVDETHYTITIAEATTAMGYKYCSGPSWDYVECGAEGEELENRVYSENDVVVAWRAVYNPEGGDTPVDPTPGEVTYALMGVGGDWTTGIALTRNESALEEEYVRLNQPIAEGEAVKVATLTDGVATAWCGNVDEATAVSYTIEEKHGNIVLAPGTYDFYYKVATDNIYIAASTATGVDNIDVEKKAVKVIRDGQMFIIRDNVVYSVLGQVVK